MHISATGSKDRGVANSTPYSSMYVLLHFGSGCQLGTGKAVRYVLDCTVRSQHRRGGRDRQSDRPRRAYRYKLNT
jgi:hypothetical protein